MEPNCNSASSVFTLELLSPAKDIDTARVALSAGADAVYVGAPKFGARQNASVSLIEIEQLCREAHSQGAKIYVALNTILYEDELKEAEKMIRSLHSAGVDALIIQDLGILQMDLPPIPLHASTQCHNDTTQKIAQLNRWGFEQVVLPREMSVENMRSIIQEHPSMKYEAFIHGALCVSFSGRCYLSHYLTGRSANRGACAQSCRLPYNLVDSRGVVLRNQEHLLSLKDLNRSELIRDMALAGISSFKIEGRLKNIPYVRNITAYYRQILDQVIASSDGKWARSSWGRNIHKFAPDPEKSFQRGYTSFNFSLRNPTHRDVINPITPKSMGEYMGQILKSSEGNVVYTDQSRDWNSGDGLFIVSRGKRSFAIDGALVNGAHGNSLRLSRSVKAEVGDKVYRNANLLFEKLLENSHASQREIDVDITLLFEKSDCLSLRMHVVGTPIESVASCEYEYQKARKFDFEKLKQVVSKLGNTDYKARQISIQIGDAFIPSSVLSDLKRQGVELLKGKTHEYFHSRRDREGLRLLKLRYEGIQNSTPWEGVSTHISEQYNVSNSLARQSYVQMGASSVDFGVELAEEVSCATPLMTTHHCILNHLGYCTRTKKVPPFELPLFLVHQKEQGEKRLRLSFDCERCVMEIFR